MTTTTTPTPGQLLRAARKSKNLSMRELARLADVSLSGVSRAETDKHPFSFTTAVALCKVTGLSIAKLARAESDHWCTHIPGEIR